MSSRVIYLLAMAIGEHNFFVVSRTCCSLCCRGWRDDGRNRDRSSGISGTGCGRAIVRGVVTTASADIEVVDGSPLCVLLVLPARVASLGVGSLLIVAVYIVDDAMSTLSVSWATTPASTIVAAILIILVVDLDTCRRRRPWSWHRYRIGVGIRVWWIRRIRPSRQSSPHLFVTLASTKSRLPRRSRWTAATPPAEQEGEDDDERDADGAGEGCLVHRRESRPISSAGG